ncbi:MAG: 16S rRNA processing protein RimM [Betaproteobacteria bacterium]|nr:16S rRNA processing protein RimM [Betaproteobacteria bacterium]
MIVLGRVLAPFGVQGLIRVFPYGDDPSSWRDMGQLWLGTGSDWKRYALKDLREHGSVVVARLEGISSRESAAALRNLLVAAPRDSLPAPSAEEYYWSDLIGLGVENLAGEPLGAVTDLIFTGAHEVLCVREGETERLLPFVAAVVREVDLERRRIRVDWGLDY